MGEERRRKPRHTPVLAPRNLIFPYGRLPFASGSAPPLDQPTPFCDSGAGLSMMSVGLTTAVLMPAI